jgi:4-hydroxyphenylpyruvate dioxygenase-like putative hemolysin
MPSKPHIFTKQHSAFNRLAYAGLETGVRDKASYVLKQDKIRLVLTTPLTSDSPINTHLAKHGDGVKVIALWVDDATKSFEETVKRGAKPFMQPTLEKDEFGEVIRSGIYTYGETVHVFVERKKLQRHIFPGLSGMEIRLQSNTGWVKIYRPHGRKCRLERNEYLGKVVRRRNGFCQFLIV